MLNRSALIVRPAEPFIKWALSLDDSGLAPSTTGEQSVYLLPEWGDQTEAEQILKSIWAEVFDRELFGWHTDESAWPKKRTLKMFKEWFTIEMHSMIENLCAYPIEDDELEDY